MTEDARLSEFLSDGADDRGATDGSDNDEREPGEERDATDGSEGDEERDAEGEGTTERAESATEPGGVEPAVSTYAWGEYTCGRCGEGTARAWRADGELVCPACKPW